jgi:hypothetical protein
MLRNGQKLPLYSASNEDARNRHGTGTIFFRARQRTLERMVQNNMKKDADDRILMQCHLPVPRFVPFAASCSSGEFPRQQPIPETPEQWLGNFLRDLASSIGKFHGIALARRECGGNHQQSGNQYLFHRSALLIVMSCRRSAATLAAATFFSPVPCPTLSRDPPLYSDQNHPSQSTAVPQSRHPDAGRVAPEPASPTQWLLLATSPG